MSLIILKETRVDVNGREMILIFLLLLDMILNNQFPFSLMANKWVMILVNLSFLQYINRSFLFYFQVSGEIPSITPDNLSVRSTSGPLGPGDKHAHSLPYIDPRQPGAFFYYKYYQKNTIFFMY